MSDKRYQIIAECAYAKVADAGGISWRLFEKGAFIPASTPNLDHLLRNDYVAEVGGDVSGGLNADGVPAGAAGHNVPPGITTTPGGGSQVGANPNAPTEEQKAAAELAEKRADAQSKLPTDGSAPDGRAAQAVWVEYLVRDGGLYEDLAQQDKAELVKLAKARQ